MTGVVDHMTNINSFISPSVGPVTPKYGRILDQHALLLATSLDHVANMSLSPLL